jgi:hypothetical protein
MASVGVELGGGNLLWGMGSCKLVGGGGSLGGASSGVADKREMHARMSQIGSAGHAWERVTPRE